jgi:hypothetical protein
MNIKNSFLLAFIVFAFSSVAFGQTQSTRTQYILYGLHFIGAGQSARLTAQNPRFSDSETIPCVRVRIVFDVFEAAGDGSVRLRFSRRVSREILLDGGEAATFDYAATGRGEWVSPAVFARPEDNAPGAIQPRLLSTLGLRESGRSVLNIPVVEKGFDPQPYPPVLQDR